MTPADILAAKETLEAQGVPVTTRGIQALLGGGSLDAIRRTLRHIRDRERQGVAPLYDPQHPPRGIEYGRMPDGLTREEEAAWWDARITERRAQGYGTVAPPPPAPPDEDELAPATKEAQRRRLQRLLIESLLAEVVPWLPPVPRDRRQRNETSPLDP